MTPEQWIELGKSFGPMGIVAYLLVTAYLKREPDHPSDHEDTALEKLRAEIRAGFADMKSDLKDTRSEVSDVRDRVSRIEGAMGKDKR